MNRPIFPFTALVGQDRMKRALLLNAINPQIGGVLIRGEKGTAKSTAVRALVNLLPEITVVADCPYSCDPDRPDRFCLDCAERRAKGEVLPRACRPVRIVELPVGATEDRLIGMLDLEKAIQEGQRHFEPGLLAAANRGILYIDEVNLLSDHLVDVLLDAAAMGINFVEREGISFAHPAHFLLVGTMNPEEGELRPQLLDRFALAVEVEGLQDPSQRMEVVKRRIAFETDPVEFGKQWASSEEQERIRLQKARELLPQVHLSEANLSLLTRICIEYKVDGLRADIALYKTACTLAAYRGRTEVIEEDIQEAAELVLLHRQRRQPFQQPQFNRDQLLSAVRSPLSGISHSSSPVVTQEQPRVDHPQTTADRQPTTNQVEEKIFEVGTPFPVKPFSTEVKDKIPRSGYGRRSTTCGSSGTGHYIGSAIPKERVQDLALDATLRAAAPYQKRRRDLEVWKHEPVDTEKDSPHLGVSASPRPKWLIHSMDFREKVRETRIGNLILFVVDASGSMGSHRRMVATKGAILSLLLDAYQRRDRVGLITFRGDIASLVLPPTNSVELAEQYLHQLPTGGRTPLAQGLYRAFITFQQQKMRDKQMVPLLVLISDGRANVSLYGGDPLAEAKILAEQIRKQGIRSLIIDTEQGYVRLSILREIAASLGGQYLHLEDLVANRLVKAVRGTLNPTEY
jgi:magnesium chelatase subunit D